MAARDRAIGAVVDHLLWHAHEHGAGALRGRLEPGLVQEVARRRCLLWHRGGTLVYSRDRDLAQRVADEAILTRLEHRLVRRHHHLDDRSGPPSGVRSH